MSIVIPPLPIQSERKNRDVCVAWAESISKPCNEELSETILTLRAAFYKSNLDHFEYISKHSVIKTLENALEKCVNGKLHKKSASILRRALCSSYCLW